MIYEIEKILEMRFVILVQMNVDTTSDFFYFKPKPLKKLKKKSSFYRFLLVPFMYFHLHRLLRRSNIEITHSFKQNSIHNVICNISRNTAGHFIIIYC